MRYINLFLVLTVILCYGFGGSVNRPCTFSDTTIPIQTSTHPAGVRLQIRRS